MPSARSPLLPNLFISCSGQRGHSQAGAPHREMLPLLFPGAWPPKICPGAGGCSLSSPWHQSPAFGAVGPPGPVAQGWDGTQREVPHLPCPGLPQHPRALPCSLPAVAAGQPLARRAARRACEPLCAGASDLRQKKKKPKKKKKNPAPDFRARSGEVTRIEKMKSKWIFPRRKELTDSH